ncbi:protein-export chaperone SecB [Pararhodospirillum photometricum]|uniref:Protein-export protein SecB n=1 Tax=Pararhodospirillum photometricum DSM 122 TaxID=1150469 RepID=H6SMK7_PARPM|nr:protein-export chaperone SecB [Pararhodospirillum photometricum]CCG09142.1 Protein-export protein secB [Pararhodospirillum photometricum DSM 122]
MSQDPQASGADTPPLIINGQYIKDLSFEVPNAPMIFTRLDKTPEVSINIDVNATSVGEKAFEVVLHFQVESRFPDLVAFVAELKYGAVVTLTLPEEHLRPMLLIEVPRLLFPFARGILSDATRDGGFPPLMIQPLDFTALYRQRYMAEAGNA